MSLCVVLKRTAAPCRHVRRLGLSTGVAVPSQSWAEPQQQVTLPSFPPPPPPASSLQAKESAAGISDYTRSHRQPGARLRSIERVDAWCEAGTAMTPQDVAGVMFDIAKLRFATAVLSKTQCKYVKEQVINCEESWPADVIGRVCYGLQAWPPSEATQILGSVLPRLPALAEPLTEKYVGMMLYGTRYCKDGPEIKSFFAHLAGEIPKCQEEFNGQTIGNAIYSLKGFVYCEKVQALLAVLARKLAECVETMKGQEIANALYGLQRCKDGHELRTVIGILAQRLKVPGTELSTQEIACAMFGLQSGGGSAEMRDLLGTLAEKILVSKGEFNTQGVSNCLYGLNQCSDTAELRQVIGAIATKLQESSVPPLHIQQMSMILYGLRGCSDCDELRSLLGALAVPIVGDADTQPLANCLYGLQRCHDSPEVRAVLRVLQPCIIAAQQTWSGQNVSNALYGILRCGDSKETRAILGALAPKIVETSCDFSSQHISMSLYSLNNYKDGPELRAILGAIAPKIASCQERLTAQSIGNSLYGLRGCSSCPEMRAVLQGLAVKIAECEEQMTDVEISNALFGLRDCRDSPELRAVLEPLADKIRQCSGVLTSHSTANALSGLKECGDSSTVCAVLGALAPKIAGHTGVLKGYQIAKCLQGLRRCKDGPGLRAVLAALMPRMEGCEPNLTHQHLAIALGGLQGCSSEAPETEAVLNMLSGKTLRDPEHETARGVESTVLALDSIRQFNGVQSVVAALSDSVARMRDELSHRTILAAHRVATTIRGPEGETLLQALGPRAPRMRQEGSQPENLAGGARRRKLSETQHVERLELPPGWTAHRDGERVFYHHSRYGSQWSLPGLRLPPGWAAHEAPDGRTFYFHEEHGSVWELPVDAEASATISGSKGELTSTSEVDAHQSKGEAAEADKVRRGEVVNEVAALAGVSGSAAGSEALWTLQKAGEEGKTTSMPIADVVPEATPEAALEQKGPVHKDCKRSAASGALVATGVAPGATASTPAEAANAALPREASIEVAATSIEGFPDGDNLRSASIK